MFQQNQSLNSKMNLLLTKAIRNYSDLWKYASDLLKEKPLIICGDLNCSILDEDVYSIRRYYRYPGLTVEERTSFHYLIKLGFIDAFKAVHPDSVGSFTFWQSYGQQREKNQGFRLDYFLIQEAIEAGAEEQPNSFTCCSDGIIVLRIAKNKGIKKKFEKRKWSWRIFIIL